MGDERGDGPVLVIGFGNTLRADDGLGPRAADLVASWGCPGVRALAVHQLTPELAEPIAASRLAVFVDVRLEDDGGEVRVEPIGPGPERGGPTAHAGDPAALLSTALAVFGRCPEAWVVSAPAADLGFGEVLSPVAARGLADSLRAIARLLGDRGVAADRGRPPSEPPDVHEISVMQSVLELALDSAGRAGASRIEAIALRVGAASGVDPEALGFAFDVVTRGTAAEGARLDLEVVPISCTCADCGREFRSDRTPPACPTCRGPGSNMLGGRELELAHLEVT